MKTRICFVMLFTLLASAAQTSNARAGGVMIQSNTNHGLAINAYGGAQHGTVLKLVNNCPPSNSDCTWTFLDNGMIVSDTNPGLAINAYGGAQHGTILKLVNNCSPSNGDCTWTKVSAAQGSNIPTPTDNFLRTGLFYTDLKANHKMWTDAKLDRSTGHLTASTRYQTGTWFGGYTGGAEISLVDKDNITIYNTHAEIHGVDGTLIGRSDWTVPWSEDIPLEVVALTDRLVVTQYWAVDWKRNLDKWLVIGKDISQGVAEVKKVFNGRAGSSDWFRLTFTTSYYGG